MGRYAASGLLVVVLLGAGCGTSEQSVDLGPVEHIAGLVAASGPPGREPPALVAGFSPDIPTTLANKLERSGEVRVVVRVIVGANSEPIGVKIAEIQPADSAAAQKYAEAVSAAVWKWRYRESKGGTRVLDLTFEPQAEQR